MQCFLLRWLLVVLEFNFVVFLLLPKKWYCCDCSAGIPNRSFYFVKKGLTGTFFFLLDCVIWAFQSTACWGWTVWFCNNVGICNTGLLHNLSRAVLRLWNLSRVRLLFLAKTTGKPEIWSFVPCGMASFVHCNRWEPWPHDKTVHSLPCYGCYSLHRFLFSFVFPRSVLRFYLLGFLLRDAQDHFAMFCFFYPFIPFQLSRWHPGSMSWPILFMSMR